MTIVDIARLIWFLGRIAIIIFLLYLAWCFIMK